MQGLARLLVVYRTKVIFVYFMMQKTSLTLMIYHSSFFFAVVFRRSPKSPSLQRSHRVFFTRTKEKVVKTWSVINLSLTNLAINWGTVKPWLDRLNVTYRFIHFLKDVNQLSQICIAVICFLSVIRLSARLTLAISVASRVNLPYMSYVKTTWLGSKR